VSKVTKILEILNDEQWHTLKEIQEILELNEKQIRQIVKFLKEYGFIIANETNGEVKLEEAVGKFLMQNATS